MLGTLFERNYLLVILFGLILLIPIGLSGTSYNVFAQEESVDYADSGYLFHIMMNSASDLFSDLTNAPNSEYIKEIQTPDGLEEWVPMSSDEIENFKLKKFNYAIEQIDFSFGVLSETIPKSHEFHSILDEAISLKQNNQFEESLAKYQLALDSYEKWYVPTVKDDSIPDDSKVNDSSDEEINQEIVQPTTTTQQEEGGGCLIATATYGSELAPQVQQLRELRDHSLLQTEYGTLFMKSFNDFYYSFSPVIADHERENPMFREAVKLAVTPLITSLSILNYVDMDSESSVLGYGVSLILLNFGMYFVAPAIVICKIKNYTVSKKRSFT